MKRYRLYHQENGRLHKLKGRYLAVRPKVPALPYNSISKFIDVKACGYDTIEEAHGLVKKLSAISPKTQFCIIDFESGKIVSVKGLPFTI